MILAFVLAAMAAPMPAPKKETGCQTRRCHIRVAHRQANAKKRRVIAPYVGWLRSLAHCESTNNGQAHDPSGTYHGYFQFDLQTYRSVGGKHDPHLDGWLEQSYRTVLLRQRRGTSPWPVCGA